MQIKAINTELKKSENVMQNITWSPVPPPPLQLGEPQWIQPGAEFQTIATESVVQGLGPDGSKCESLSQGPTFCWRRGAGG